jgi:hypothetical protein
MYSHYVYVFLLLCIVVLMCSFVSLCILIVMYVPFWVFLGSVRSSYSKRIIGIIVYMVHFLLTDQCTIQTITKLVFSITTLKFKIWLKFL